MGLRWEFATPVYDRDNLWSNFDPTTNSLVRATGGSLYNRSLVNPDYKDWGPRLGMAYSQIGKTSVRAGYGISYTFFNRPGERSRASMAAGGLRHIQSVRAAWHARIPHHAERLQRWNRKQPLNPVTSNNDYIPANTRWPYVQSWVFSIQRELMKNTVLEIAYNGNHSLRLPIIGDYNQVYSMPLAAAARRSARRPDQSFGPITWVDPAGNNHYNGLSARFEHRFSQGLYFLNSFTWGNAIGDSEQALEYYSNLTGANPQNIRNLAAEKGPSSYDAKFVNVTSVVYQLPFGKGQKFLNGLHPALDTVFGGWEVNGINTASTGLPINIYYTPSAANDVTGLGAEYRGQAFQRPNVSGSAASQSTGQSLISYFAGYTFTTPPSNAPFGNLGRNVLLGSRPGAMGLGG